MIYENLWNAVIEKAYMDAMGEGIVRREIRRGRPPHEIARNALDWFFDPEYEEDRRIIGDLATDDINWYIRRLKTELGESHESSTISKQV